jgi:hypothetical protein
VTGLGFEYIICVHVCVRVCRRAVLCVTELDFVHMTYVCVCVHACARVQKGSILCDWGRFWCISLCVCVCVCRRAVLGVTGLGFVHISVLYNISHCTVTPKVQ